MFVCFVWVWFFFLGGRFSCDPSIHSGANARKVTLTTLTSQMNSFSVCLFFSFVVFFFFFTQDVLSVVNIYYDLPKSCDF